MSIKVPILMYHRIADEPRNLRDTLSRRQFVAQMRFLAAPGYRVIDLDTVLMGLERRVPLHPRTVAITFDDGFRDTVTHACPVLKELGFPATFFLVAGRVGQRAPWIDHCDRDAWLLDWATASTLVAEGFAVGSHSGTHPALDDLSTQAAIEEIAGSKHMLEDRLGVPVQFFAYPFGRFNARVRALVRDARYAAACSSAPGFNSDQTDRYALRRLDVHGTDSLRRFARKLEFGANEMTLARLVRYYSRRAAARLKRLGI